MRELLLDEVKKSVRTAFPGVGAEVVDRVTLESPRDPSHGDFSSNIAFLLKDIVREAPRSIAEKIVEQLTREASIGAAEVAGPGFINLRVRPQGMLKFLEKLATAQGRAELLRDRELAQKTGKMQVEFVSANPTGPLNVVSARAAAYGDASIRLLRAVGVDAYSEYYVNDEGNQARIFGESLKVRFLQAAGKKVELPEDAYRGAYVADVARALYEEERSKAGPSFDAEASAATLDFQGLGLDRMIAAARASLLRFGVEFDCWFRESYFHRAKEGESLIHEAEKRLQEKGHLFQQDGATWFRSTAFGDDKDRVIRRSDGEPTYLLGDIAYHLEKARRGFQRVIDVWGPDHHGYIARMKAATQALGLSVDWLDVVIVQQVNFLRGGQPVRMSKREGEFITLDDVIDEVGADVARFIFLTRRASSHLDFDLDLAKKESLDNPVFYVQYAHARSRSIFRQPMAQQLAPRAGEVPDPALLNGAEEVAMMRLLLQYPQVVKESALALEPHRLVAYLREVAGAYHRFYTRGKQEPSFRVLVEDERLARARLALVGILADVLREGLGLLGIRALEEM
ncbi:MAG TPA: arginine--tRNA ligase [bacterium]|nr:arginine--tRNA ligase [bacterium]